jgi:hypothetical protein
VLNQLICSRILLGFHHYIPHIISNASKNLMERKCKKMTEIEKITYDSYEQKWLRC